MRGYQLIFVILLWAGCPAPLHAVPRYLCRGRVQSTPCNLRSLNVPARRLGAGRFGNKTGIPSKLSISNQSFTRIAKDLGLWTGRIRGDGYVSLSLRILRHGALESVRYIGQVKVTLDEKPTKFNFRSTLPKGNGWSWQILAQIV